MSYTPPVTSTTASRSPHALSFASTIPPLDHIESPRAAQQRGSRRVLRSVLTLLAGAAIGGMIGVVGVRLLSSSALRAVGTRHRGPGALAAWIALLVVTALVVIAIHEGGHAVGGRLGRLRLIAFVVGPLQLVRADGRLRIALNRNVGHAGGLVLCVPTRWAGDRAFRRAFRWCVAAGPLASLVAGAAAVVVVANMPPAPPWTSALFVAGIMSSAIGIGTLIPLRMSGGMVSDGGQLLRFRESRARPGSAAASLAPLSAITLFAQTERPRAWDPDLVREVTAAAEHQEHAASALSFLYYRALDTGDVRNARDTLQRVLERAAKLTSATSDRSRRILMVEAAIFEGAWRRDPQAARAWLDAAQQGEALDPHGTFVACAAIAACEGSPAESRRALHEAAAVAQRSLFPGIALCRLATTERLAAALG